MLKKYNQRFAEGSEPGYLEDYKEGIYTNYFSYVLNYVKSHSGHDYPRDSRSSLLVKNATTINRCFFPSTLEEITENLRREASEGSKFAQVCL